jgi:GTP-binding protein
MIIKTATFVGSFTSESNSPTETIPEFAFIGRSNVGKSSLINMLCNRKDLVKISRTPGKTQTLNFFRINDQLHFVDLPGYGYAKVSKSMRQQWEAMINNYLVKRQQLRCVFMLIDARLTPQQLDLEFAKRLRKWDVPFALIFTKSDKAGNVHTAKNMHLFLAEMRTDWITLPETFITSAEKKTGKTELLYFMEHVLDVTAGSPKIS